MHAGRSFSPAVNILPWIYFADMVSLRVNKIDSVSPLRTGLALSPRKKPLRSKSTGSLGSHASGWDAVSLRFLVVDLRQIYWAISSTKLAWNWVSILKKRNAGNLTYSLSQFDLVSGKFDIPKLWYSWAQELCSLSINTSTIFKGNIYFSMTINIIDVAHVNKPNNQTFLNKSITYAISYNYMFKSGFTFDLCMSTSNIHI